MMVVYPRLALEAMYMMKKAQIHSQVKSAQNEVGFIHQLFGIVS